MPSTDRAKRTLMTLGTTLGAVALTSSLAAGAAAAPRDTSGDNGVEELNAQEIGAKADAAFKSAGSVRMTLVDPKGETGAQAFDVSTDRSGNCVGTMDLGKTKGAIDIIVQGDTVWFKPDARMLRDLTSDSSADTAAGKDLEGKYLKGSKSSDDFKDFAEMCDLSSWQDELTGADFNSSEQGTPAEVKGTPAVRISGKDDDGDTFTEYVATRGEPYPLKLVATDEGEVITFTLTDYGKPVTVTPPPASQTVDWSS